MIPRANLIVRARHPLQEQVLDTFVPNDARLVGGAGIGTQRATRYSTVGAEPDDEGTAWHSVLLCTGANACGKVCPGCF